MRNNDVEAHIYWRTSYCTSRILHAYHHRLQVQGLVHCCNRCYLTVKSWMIPKIMTKWQNFQNKTLFNTVESCKFNFRNMNKCIKKDKLTSLLSAAMNSFWVIDFDSILIGFLRLRVPECVWTWTELASPSPMKFISGVSLLTLMQSSNPFSSKLISPIINKLINSKLSYGSILFWSVCLSDLCSSLCFMPR